ncbi:MAG TPA: sigma factor, partial [Ktedonobacteraceae bacterium]
MPEQSSFEYASTPPVITKQTQGEDIAQEIGLEEEQHAANSPSSAAESPKEDFEAGVLAQLDSLYRTALRLTNNPQEAEDLVQETMLKAFRFAHTYQAGTNLRAWLFRILNTSAINRYRRLGSHPTPASLPEGEEFYLYNQIRDLSGQELSQGAED